MTRFFASCLVLVTIGCGGGSAAREVEPKAPTYAGATGSPTAVALTGASEPLVVDWTPEQRSDLEVAMKDALAVVSYDERGLRLLKQCSGPGSYGFKGVTRKERVIHLKDADEVRANLPLNGIALVGGEIRKGRTLDVALVIVGKKVASRPALARDVLKGDCKGATHYVQAVTTGAFAMATSTGARLEAAVDVFSVGAKGSSVSSTEQGNRDGDLTACQSAHASDEQAPDQCGAILRVELRAVDAPVQAEDSWRGHTCPKDMVYSADRCTARPTTKVCERSDAKGCIAACAERETESCTRLAALTFSHKIPDASWDASIDAMRKGCDAGSAVACLIVGIDFNYPKHKKQGRGDLAKEFYERACSLGDLSGCNNLAFSLQEGTLMPKDEAAAVALFQQACTGGHGLACVNLGHAKRDGIGGPADAKAAERAFARARAITDDECESGSGEGCASIATMYSKGDGYPKDPKRARELFLKGCDLGYAASCRWAKE